MKTLLCFVAFTFCAQHIAGMVQVEEPEIVSKFTREKLNTWKAPKELQKNFPYYWSGFDEEGRPVWVLEFGKWDLRKIAEGGNLTLRNFDTYIDQVICNAYHSLKWNSTSEDSSRLVAIVDMDGWSLRQMTRTTVLYIIEKFNYIASLVIKYVDHVYIVNTNYMAESLVNALRPVVGSVMERVELWGTQKSKWVPRVLSSISQNELPSWYGGSKDFKPIQVHG